MLYQYAVHNYVGKQQYVLSFFPVIQQYARHVCLHLASIDASPPGSPVVGQNLIQNVRFLSTKNGRVGTVCLVGYLLPFYIKTHVLGGYANLIFMSWWSMIDIVIWQPCLTKPIWFGKVQLAVVPEALHDCHWYFSKGRRFGRTCLGKFPLRLGFLVGSLWQAHVMWSRRFEHNASCRFIHGVTM